MLFGYQNKTLVKRSLFYQNIEGDVDGYGAPPEIRESPGDKEVYCPRCPTTT